MLMLHERATVGDLAGALNLEGRPHLMTSRMRTCYHMLIHGSEPSFSLRLEGQLVWMAGLFPGKEEFELWFMPGAAFSEKPVHAFRLGRRILRKLSPHTKPIVSYIAPGHRPGERLAAALGMTLDPAREASWDSQVYRRWVYD